MVIGDAEREGAGAGAAAAGVCCLSLSDLELFVLISWLHPRPVTSNTFSYRANPKGDS